MTDTEKIAKILKNYDVIPILLGKDAFNKAETILSKKLYFNSLQDAVSIL
jgi:hypothetical protein